MMEKLTKMIQDLMDKKWFGAIEIKMESGKIVIIRKTETIKPENLK